MITEWTFNKLPWILHKLWEHDFGLGLKPDMSSPKIRLLSLIALGQVIALNLTIFYFFGRRIWPLNTSKFKHFSACVIE